MANLIKEMGLQTLNTRDSDRRAIGQYVHTNKDSLAAVMVVHPGNFTHGCILDQSLGICTSISVENKLGWHFHRASPPHPPGSIYAFGEALFFLQ